MHAALVTSFDSAPSYSEVAEPKGGKILTMRAAALHQLVRARASGKHYSSDAGLPLVPGVDGVGEDASGRLFYVMTAGSGTGTMAERISVSESEGHPAPAGADPALIAAGVNPTMASWLALHTRINFVPGSSVAIMGASGSSGQAAIQVAKNAGAGEVIALGRDASRLEGLRALGADRVLNYDDAGQAAEADVVLDFVWGAVAESVLPALVRGRSDSGKPLTWVQIGSLAGPNASLGAAALRSNKLTLLGSGIGAVTPDEFAAGLPKIIAELAAGQVAVDYSAAPLAEVHERWEATSDGGARLVFVP